MRFPFFHSFVLNVFASFISCILVFLIVAFFLQSKVEPEIEVKVQEIVERDRIIEEKIEQIEQQNKILVEIQITLDEKQKQIADMEQKISDYSAKITKLNEELDKACKTIQVRVIYFFAFSTVMVMINIILVAVEQ